MKKSVTAFALSAVLATCTMAAEDVSTFSQTISDKLGKGKIEGQIVTTEINAKDDYMSTKRMNIKRVDSKGNVLWTVRDFVEDCPLEAELSLLAPVEVTDVNDNGLNEVWMLYKMSCRGDVSPSNMKIIMYEGKTKHAMRGYTQIDLPSEGTFEGGDYKMDANMENAHPNIREYAELLWNKYKREM